MNRLPPNYRQTTANAVNRQTANRLYVIGGGGGGSGGGNNRQPNLPGVRTVRASTKSARAEIVFNTFSLKNHHTQTASNVNLPGLVVVM
jgi:hypothetical protein